MEFFRKHWLGLLVLLLLTWASIAIANHDMRGARLPGTLFWFFFLPWLWRAIFRFIGRAFGYGFRSAQKTVR
jgi:hypothetical protein